MATTYDATVAHGGLCFGEVPRWHGGRLWFCDFYRHGIFSLGDDGERREHTIDSQPSGLGWRDDGTLLVVSMTDHKVLAIDRDGAVREHADIAEHCGYWANDMVVAPNGTAYVGNFGFDFDAWFQIHGIPGLLGESPIPSTNLVVLAPDGSVAQVVPDLTFPNGMVLDDDLRTLIVAETLASRLSAFDVASDGTLSNRRVFAQLSLVFPDGICLDAEGQVWVANAASPECVRVAEGGEVTARVATSQPAYACMLGGAERTTLHVMTAPTSMAEDLIGTHDGKVEVAEVAVRGAGLP